jgi:hypothetical protein
MFGLLLNLLMIIIFMIISLLLLKVILLLFIIYLKIINKFLFEIIIIYIEIYRKFCIYYSNNNYNLYNHKNYDDNDKSYFYEYISTYININNMIKLLYIIATKSNNVINYIKCNFF